MSDPNDQKATVGAPIPTAPPAAGDTESQTPAAGTGVGHIIRKWKREDLLKRGSLGLRCIALLFSLLAFIIMASNKHGDWKDFDRYEEYRYNRTVQVSFYTMIMDFCFCSVFFILFYIYDLEVQLDFGVKLYDHLF